MSVLLGVALFGPAALLVLDRRRTQQAGLGVAALWLVVGLVDSDATLGRFAAAGFPVAVGTWLLVASISWPATRAVTRLTVAAAGLAAAGGALAADRADAVGALALAAAVLVVAARLEADGALVPALVAVVGVALVALGARADGASTLVLLGGALAAGAAAWRARRAGVVLLPLVLLVTSLHPTLEWWHALVVGAAATVLAGRRPHVAGALWAVAAGALGAGALLLGATAVLLAAALHPALALTALPGLAVAVTAVADLHSRWSLVLAALAALTAVRLWRRPDDGALPGRPSDATVASVAIGAWLLLAPETWVSATALESWGTGALIAVVAGAVGAFLAASFTEATYEAPEVEVADPLYVERDPGWAWPASLASLAILAISGGALVASVVS